MEKQNPQTIFLNVFHQDLSFFNIKKDKYGKIGYLLVFF